MIGDTLGHYRILDKLAAGGMGVVYVASDTRLDRQVALKVLPPEMAAKPELRRRFESEANGRARGRVSRAESLSRAIDARSELRCTTVVERASSRIAGGPTTMTAAATSGYSSRFFRVAYAWAGPLYDLLVWWGFLPLGGERACRRELVRWIGLRPGMRVASLCCGTGSMERAMLADEPELVITGVDLGRAQLARAQKKNRGAGITYILRDACRSALPDGHYDRVLIVLALHEMKRPTRLALLREAGRLCAPEGRVIAIEHGRPRSAASRLLRELWWFFWIPGNPERETSRDLQRHGLETEMRDCGLTVLEHHVTRPDWIEGFLASPHQA